MLMTFILVVHALIALGLVAVILLQRSEGGALGIGGGAGLVSARGAADLLTRTTSILAVAFVVTSILLAVLAAAQHKDRVINTSLAKPSTTAPAGVPIVPNVAAAVPATPAATAPAPADTVPLAK
jgi:preprotein translocase subunit SecG